MFAPMMDNFGFHDDTGSCAPNNLCGSPGGKGVHRSPPLSHHNLLHTSQKWGKETNLHPEAAFSVSALVDNRRNLRRSSHNYPQHYKGAQLQRGCCGWTLHFVRGGSRGTALLCILVATCVLLLLAAGLVFYIYSAMTSLTPKMDSENYSIPGGNVVFGKFRVNNVMYEPAFGDKTSPVFRHLGLEISFQLDALFSSSLLNVCYNHSSIFRIQPDTQMRILVDSRLELNCVYETSDAASQAGIEFLHGLKHHDGQLWLGNFSIDVQSITFHSTSETGNFDLRPGWSSWSEWSECLSSGIQIRKRRCSLKQGNGVPLASIQPCLGLDNITGDVEERKCDTSEPHLQDQQALYTEAFTNEISESSEMFSRSSNMLQSKLNDLLTTQYTASPILLSNNITYPNQIQTTKITIMDLSLPEGRNCDDCTNGEVCVGLLNEQVPTCRLPVDKNDPTGCGGHCRINTEYCQKLDTDAFKCMDASYCLPDEWQCENQLCIPLVKRCDGHINCFDMTDEFDCECNLTTHFHCQDNTSCLPLSKRCDKTVDCWDGSDESNCTIACPSDQQFTCTNGDCIPRQRFCDGFADCSDNSDEPFGCKGKCKTHEWKCGNGRCIKKSAVCDGADTCGDQSDESKCSARRMRAQFGNKDQLHLRR